MPFWKRGKETSYEAEEGQRITSQWNTPHTKTVYTENPDAIIAHDRDGSILCRCYKAECQTHIDDITAGNFACPMLRVITS